MIGLYRDPKGEHIFGDHFTSSSAIRTLNDEQPNPVAGSSSAIRTLYDEHPNTVVGNAMHGMCYIFQLYTLS